MKTPMIAGLVVLVTMFLAAAAAAQDSFDQRLERATRVLIEMGEKPGVLRTNNYHVLYACRKEFAEERKVALEATRRNFLGFLRKLDLKIDPQHEKLLVIVLDTEEQMRQFTRKVTGGAAPGENVGGYYSRDLNWAVFFNQRKDSELIAWEKWLDDMAQQLIKLPGGSNTKVSVTTPNGVVTLTKAEVARQMTQKWQEVTAAISATNADVTQHEGAHQLAFNVGVQRRGAEYPFWVSEGLACLFEVPPKAPGAQGAAAVNRSRLAAYRNVHPQAPLDLSRALTRTAGELGDSPELAYAESWALFAFLFHRQPKQLSAYLDYLAERPPRPESPQPGEGESYDELAEFQRFFPQSLEDLRRALDKYLATLK